MRRVEGVVLAAGPSRRFRAAASGAPEESLPTIKQLLRFGGESLVRRTSRTALSSGLARVLVVVGCEAEAVRAEIDDLGVALVDNPRFEDGQSSSVRAALDHLDAETEAALFIPCDQPFLGADTIDRLLAAWDESASQIVVPTFEGRRGAPVLIARPLFGELGRIEGDSGGRQIFAAHPELLAEVEVADGLALRDIDTPADYRDLRGPRDPA